MELFVLTLHCSSRAHCKTCRNLKGGRKWRQSIGKVYKLPEAEAGAEDPADFICPHGLKWNDVIEGKSVEPEVKTTQKISKSENMRNSGSRGRRGCGCSRNK